MGSLDLSSWLNLVSTIAIVVALVFAGLQVRQANLSRRDQAQMACIQSAQSDSWTRAVMAVAQLPAEASAEQVDASGDWAAAALTDFGVRLESIAYMVFIRLVSLEMVDGLIGGVILMFWSRAASWTARERTRSGNPRMFEWCEWLADRLRERRATRGTEPAHLKHRSWR